MRTRDLLRAEAELQRQNLRAEIDARRRQPASLISSLSAGGLGALALRRVLPGVLGRRSPLLVYGWLAYKAWRVFFPPAPRKRLTRRVPPR